MRTRPIDSLALRASKEFFLVMKNEIRNLSLDLLRDIGSRRALQRRHLEKTFPHPFRCFLLNEFFQLELRLIFCNSKDHIFRSSWDEFGVSS
jgi:hypothetical protein